MPSPRAFWPSTLAVILVAVTGYSGERAHIESDPEPVTARPKSAPHKPASKAAKTAANPAQQAKKPDKTETTKTTSGGKNLEIVEKLDRKPRHARAEPVSNTSRRATEVAADQASSTPVPLLDFPQAACETGQTDCDSCRSGGGGCCCCRRPRRITKLWTSLIKPSMQASHWGYRDEFCEQPFGANVHSHIQTQVFNGLADQMVLYEYDFHDDRGPDADKLNARGIYQLEKIVERFLHGLSWIVVASTEGKPDLDQARKQAVERQLEEMRVPFSSDQVVIRRAPKQMLGASEALLIWENNQSLIQSRGTSGVSTTGSTRGTVGVGAGVGRGR